MPLIYPAVLIAGALGFGGGVVVSDGLAKLGRLVLIAGTGYVIYNQVKKS